MNSLPPKNYKNGLQKTLLVSLTFTLLSMTACSSETSFWDKFKFSKDEPGLGARRSPADNSKYIAMAQAQQNQDATGTDASMVQTSDTNMPGVRNDLSKEDPYAMPTPQAAPVTPVVRSSAYTRAVPMSITPQATMPQNAVPGAPPMPSYSEVMASNKWSGSGASVTPSAAYIPPSAVSVPSYNQSATNSKWSNPDTTVATAATSAAVSRAPMAHPTPSAPPAMPPMPSYQEFMANKDKWVPPANQTTMPSAPTTNYNRPANNTTPLPLATPAAATPPASLNAPVPLFSNTPKNQAVSAPTQTTSQPSFFASLFGTTPSKPASSASSNATSSAPSAVTVAQPIPVMQKDLPAPTGTATASTTASYSGPRPKPAISGVPGYPDLASVPTKPVEFSNRSGLQREMNDLTAQGQHVNATLAPSTSTTAAVTSAPMVAPVHLRTPAIATTPVKTPPAVVSSTPAPSIAAPAAIPQPVTQEQPMPSAVPLPNVEPSFEEPLTINQDQSAYARHNGSSSDGLATAPDTPSSSDYQRHTGSDASGN